MMKNNIMFALLIIIGIVCGVAQAQSWVEYDMSDYGTTANVSNDVNVSSMVSYALLDNASLDTNAVAILIGKATGVATNRVHTYFELGAVTVLTNAYGSVDLVDMEFRSDDILRITVVDTNVTVLIKQE